MDQNFQELITRMEANSRKQVAYARVQCIFSVVAAVCCIALLIVGIAVLPKLQTVAQQADVVLSNLESVTSELAEVDLTGMVDQISGLVSTSQQGVESTMQKINQIDFEALNKAIKDLSAVIEPIADFFNMFGK